VHGENHRPAACHWQTLLYIYNYHPCWSVTRRFVSQRKVRSPEGLASDLIKHCHVIFIHLWGQPLIVRSHSEVHQIWRHLLSVEKLQIFQHLVFIKILLHVFNHLVSVTKLRVIGHLVSVTKLHVFNHLRSLLLVEETGAHGENHRPAACHWQTLLYIYNYNPCWSVTGRFVSQRKVRSPEGLYRIFLHQTPNNRIPAAFRQTPSN
jgi:hypothetical protein